MVGTISISSYALYKQQIMNKILDTESTYIYFVVLLITWRLVTYCKMLQNNTNNYMGRMWPTFVSEIDNLLSYSSWIFICIKIFICNHNHLGDTHTDFQTITIPFFIFYELFFSYAKKINIYGGMCNCVVFTNRLSIYPCILPCIKINSK